MNFIRSLQILSTTLAAVCMLGALASPAAHAAGVCREAKCADAAPREDKCDRAGLAEATREFKREMEAYDEAKKKATEQWDEASEIYKKADEQFRETFSLPEASTAGLELSMHVVMERIIASGGGKAAEHLAEEFASVASTVSLALMLAKGAEIDVEMVKSLNAFNEHGDAALKDMDEAYPHLQQARKAHEKMDKMAANCKVKDSGDGKTAKDENKPDDEWKPSGQREAEAAQKLMTSWKKIGGAYEYATNKFVDADKAFDKALAIVQSRDESAIMSGFIRVAATATIISAGASSGQPLSNRQRSEAIKQIASAFRNITAAGKYFVRIGDELKKIGDTQAQMKL